MRCWSNQTLEACPPLRHDKKQEYFYQTGSDFVDQQNPGESPQIPKWYLTHNKQVRNNVFLTIPIYAQDLQKYQEGPQ